MGALGHYLEEEGVATTQISLIREHTAAMRPPRSLWVPFILGRPFGVPNDPNLQRRVLLSALRLLEAPSGPVLEDFPQEAAASDGESAEPFVCPVSFGTPSAEGDLAAECQREVAELSTWYELTRSRRRRTTVGLSGLTPAAAAKFLCDFVANPSVPIYRDGFARVPALRLVAHDIRAYYLESVASQPGAKAAAEAEEWFWLRTVVGRVMFRLREVCLADQDPSLQRYGMRAVPTRFTPR